MVERLRRRILVEFEAGATTATYTEQVLDEAGGVDLEKAEAAYFDLSRAALMDIFIPAGVAAGVDALQFQDAKVPDGTWGDSRNTSGDLIAVASVQTVKGDSVTVDADICSKFWCKLVPVDSGGSPVAPGAVTFEIGIKA